MDDLHGKGVNVELKNVSRLFQIGGETFQALADVTLSVPAGEHWSLVGASGSGKSTLLYMMGLLERPSSGEVWIDGQRTDTLKTGERALIRNRRIGFVFQNFQLIPRTTSLENVEMPLLYQKVPFRERQERAKVLLSQVGLSDRKNHFPSQLSGGQQQRVAIARALVTSPGIVLADEPTGNLDTASSKDILELLEHLRTIHRFTLILVTHDPLVASRAQRQIRLSDGRIVGGEL